MADETPKPEELVQIEHRPPLLKGWLYEPVDIKNVPAREAIHKILNPMELTYDLDENGLYLDKRKSQVLVDCYICQVSDKQLDEETVIQIKSLFGEKKIPPDLKIGISLLDGKILRDITNNGNDGKQCN